MRNFELRMRNFELRMRKDELRMRDFELGMNNVCRDTNNGGVDEKDPKGIKFFYLPRVRNETRG